MIYSEVLVAARLVWSLAADFRLNLCLCLGLHSKSIIDPKWHDVGCNWSTWEGQFLPTIEYDIVSFDILHVLPPCVCEGTQPLVGIHEEDQRRLCRNLLLVETDHPR